MAEIPSPNSFADHWMLDQTVVFLNHGSFGAAPRVVLEAQSELRRLMETEPLQFFDHFYLPALDQARDELAEFIGAQSSDLALVVNATTGVNTVLRSLDLEAGDELLVTDQEYNACRNALNAVAAAAGAKVVVATVPFPIASEDEIVEAVIDRMGPHTRLVLVDHVTSQTGMVLPIQRLVDEVQASGADVLVDGAHAPGMVELELDRLGAAYYTGNCHKWLCAPKGAAFLHVREDRRRSVRPLTISHGANAAASQRSRFHLEHDWTGTRDPSAWMCIPAAIAAMESMVEGGWNSIRHRNRLLAIEARKIVCEMLGVEIPCPESLIGSLASIPLPDGEGAAVNELFPFDELQIRLFEEFRIEIPVIAWPAPPKRLVRLSAQIYNRREHYEYLGSALVTMLR